MSETTEASAPSKQRGYTKEMREARAAKLAAQPGLASVPAPTFAATADAEPVPTGRPTRHTRKPFGSTNQKLAYPQREGYHRHWFNDNPGRIEYATDEAGYTHVKDPRTGKNVQRVVGTREGGHPIIGYLLEIPQEWFDDDMARYENENAARDDAIRRGAVKAEKPEDRGRFYPEAQGRGIKIDQSTRRR